MKCPLDLRRRSNYNSIIAAHTRREAQTSMGDSEMRCILVIAGGSLAAAVASLVIYYQLTIPTNDGPWKAEYERLASVRIENGLATIENLRRVRYDSDGHPLSIDWTGRSLVLSDLIDVWFGISVFASPGLAHTFLSFDFGDGDPVVISVEARQRPEQHYSPMAGALDRYHLIYVIADEQDIIGVRVQARREEVFFQPLSISGERAQRLFRDMVARANGLSESPDFYNTFTSNCTTSILEHTKLPWWQRYFDPRILLPGFSDRIAYKYGVLDNDYSRKELRAAAHLKSADFEDGDPLFSQKIRASFRDRINLIG